MITVNLRQKSKPTAEYGIRRASAILDAVGPETYTFDEMVRLIAAKVNSKAKIVHLAPKIALSLYNYLDGYKTLDKERIVGYVVLSQRSPEQSEGIT